MQNNMELKIMDLENCNARIQRKTFKEKILGNALKLFKGRKMIIEAFKDGTFRLFEEIENSPFDSEFDSESDSESDSKKSEQKFDKSIAERVKLRRQKYNELNELTAKNAKTIDK